jgi:peptidoglycan/LPS O-acetylase OafA/YrhL
MPPHDPHYRPHLDGIRALAVVLVILFHLGLAWLPGGFVGVDVFFVLSGYLITGILLREASTSGRIRLSRFYARRARRLLPASIAVLASVVALGHLTLDRVQQDSLGRDGWWSALYSANWRFGTVGGDYFAPGDVPSALVHYWSLAVEEQFYLVWPALLLGLYLLTHRRGRTARPGVLLAIVVALGGASAWWSVAKAGTPLTYYGTHARAYQLLAGASLALAARMAAGRGWRRRLPAVARTALGPLLVVGATAGLVALAHTIPDAGHYPGVPGLWVTLASLALIAGLDLAGGGLHRRAFGAWVPAAIGRWSYSLYLWHWPVIVFAPVLARRWDDPWVDRTTTKVAAMLALAGASYLLLERPVRFRLLPKARPWPVAAVGVACSAVVALVAYQVLTIPRSQQDPLAAVADQAKANGCPYSTPEWPDPADAVPCLYRDGNGPTIALVGDSHAQQWQPALEVLADRIDARVIRVTQGGCPPNDVLTINPDANGRRTPDTRCSEWRHRVFPQVAERYDPDIVFVATRSHVKAMSTDVGTLTPSRPGYLERWTASWDWTIDTLGSRGATVVVSEILPTMPESVPACLLEHGMSTKRCNFAVAGDRKVGRFNTAIDSLADTHRNVVVVDPSTIPCPDGRCPAVMDGTIVHRDDNHLSATFVREHADAFGDLLGAAGLDV